jgi:Mg/Co/Ni transporter MgtE
MSRDLLAVAPEETLGEAAASEARVREWMTENPVTVPEATPIGRAASIMVTHNFRHLPIVDGERTVGIISLRDVVHSVVREYPEYEDEDEEEQAGSVNAYSPPCERSPLSRQQDGAGCPRGTRPRRPKQNPGQLLQPLEGLR